MIQKKFDFEKFPYPILGITFFSSIQVNTSNILANINEISNKHGVETQIFNLDNVISLNHIIISAYHANKAFNNRTNLSKTITIEFLLYLSCQRQIKLALEKFGLKDGKMNLGICLFGKEIEQFNSVKNMLEELFESQENKHEFLPEKIDIQHFINIFNISSEELEIQPSIKEKKDKISIIEKIILNKMAILSLEK